MNRSMKTSAGVEHLRVLRLPMNTLGRDFVVGDIHGAYDLVIEGMRLVKFDPERDRLLGPGDLVDRGPDSARCLGYLAKPYVKSTRGNHDHNLVSLYEDGEPNARTLEFFVRRFGAGWWMTTPADLRAKILVALAALPFAIEVQTARGLVGIVHGDVPRGMDWQTFTSHLERGTPEVVQVALEGRERLMSGRGESDAGVQGVGRVFVGHTPQRGGPKRCGNVYAVDTGGIFNVMMGDGAYALTMANIACGTLPLLAVGNDMRQILVVDGQSDEPFGAYARSE